MLRITLFVHLTTSKISIFRSITAYNTNFQTALNKLANTRSTLPSNFQLAIYLYSIEDTYFDFATFHWAVTQAKIPDISIVIAELTDKAHTLNKPTNLLIHSLNISQKKNYSRGNRNTKSRGRNAYLSRQKKNSEIYSHYHTLRHSELTYWKKYLEKLPNTKKKIVYGKKTNAGHAVNNGKKNSVFFNLVS